MKTALFIGVSLTLVALPAAAQYARSGQSAGGYRGGNIPAAPLLVRWPGVIRPGTVKNDIFAALDWMPTLVNIAGGDKGDALNKRIMAGSYPDTATKSEPWGGRSMIPLQASCAG